MTERIVVTGGDGVLGHALRDYLSASYLAHAECDVRYPAHVREVLNRLVPDVVVHAAALTDHAHPNAAEVIETNICGTEHVTRWCRAAGARLVYLSTHYVYPGDAPEGGYREHDATHPIGAYAWSKLVGERFAELVPNRLIVRGSWYTYATRIARWLECGVLTDAWTNREPVESAARKIAALVRAGVQGTVNIGGARRTFADIVRDDGYDAPNVRYITRADAAPAFPRDSSVNTAKFDALKLALNA